MASYEKKKRAGKKKVLVLFWAKINRDADAMTCESRNTMITEVVSITRSCETGQKDMNACETLDD